MNNLSVICIFW